MVSFLDYEGTDPASAAQEAGEALTKARTEVEAKGIKSFLFRADSLAEFDERAAVRGVSEVLDGIVDSYLGPREEGRAKLTAALRREFTAKVAADKCGDCPAGTKCVCTHDGCKCAKVKVAQQPRDPKKVKELGEELTHPGTLRGHESLEPVDPKEVKNPLGEQIINSPDDSLEQRVKNQKKYQEDKLKDRAAKTASGGSYATADVDFISEHDNEDDIQSELENKPVHDRAHQPDGVEVTSFEPRPGGGSYGQAQLQYVTEHSNQDDEEEELRNHPDYDGAEVSYFSPRTSSRADCTVCGGVIARFRDAASLKEASKSGMCQGCQDDYFGPAEKVAAVEEFPAAEEPVEEAPAEPRLPVWMAQSFPANPADDEIGRALTEEHLAGEHEDTRRGDCPVCEDAFGDGEEDFWD